MEEEVNEEVDLGPPLDSSTIHWRPPEDGIVLLELFGGIGSGLVAILQAGLKVKRYVRCSAIEGILHRYHHCGPIFRFGVSRKR
jgi:hypothetical protein